MFRLRFASLAVLAIGLTPLLTAGEYPPLPKAVSSFGAVACNRYAYGGWECVGTTAESRYVHRLLPAGPGKLLAVAGASPKGPHASVEEVKLDGKPAVAADNPKAQKFCPVMTTDGIDPAASDKVTYKGVTIYVCCGDCARKFNRDPAAYLDAKLIPALAGMDVPKREIEQVYCPVYKERKVSAKDPFVTYKGVKVYVYNALAKQRFEKDPDRYADVKILPQLKDAK